MFDAGAGFGQVRTFVGGRQFAFLLGFQLSAGDFDLKYVSA